MGNKASDKSTPWDRFKKNISLPTEILELYNLKPKWEKDEDGSFFAAVPEKNSKTEIILCHVIKATYESKKLMEIKAEFDQEQKKFWDHYAFSSDSDTSQSVEDLSTEDNSPEKGKKRDNESHVENTHPRKDETFKHKPQEKPSSPIPDNSKIEHTEGNAKKKNAKIRETIVINGLLKQLQKQTNENQESKKNQSAKKIQGTTNAPLDNKQALPIIESLPSPQKNTPPLSENSTPTPPPKKYFFGVERKDFQTYVGITFLKKFRLAQFWNPLTWVSIPIITLLNTLSAASIIITNLLKTIFLIPIKLLNCYLSIKFCKSDNRLFKLLLSVPIILLSLITAVLWFLIDPIQFDMKIGNAIFEIIGYKHHSAASAAAAFITVLSIALTVAFFVFVPPLLLHGLSHCVTHLPRYLNAMIHCVEKTITLFIKKTKFLKFLIEGLFKAPIGPSNLTAVTTTVASVASYPTNYLARKTQLLFNNEISNNTTPKQLNSEIIRPNTI